MYGYILFPFNYQTFWGEFHTVLYNNSLNMKWSVWLCPLIADFFGSESAGYDGHSTSCR